MAERVKLTVLMGRRAVRNLAGRVRGHPLIRWKIMPGKADRLVIAPQDLRTADGTRASEIYAGRFAFAGKVVICDGRSPFEITPPSDEWAAAVFGFGWLRHLRAAESGITRANARALVDEWITLQGSFHPVAWQPDITARRIIAWLSQAPLVLHDADEQFYRRFLRSLQRQVRYLRHTAGEASEGVPRMQAHVALTYAALCMAGQARHLRTAVKNLVAEIERQILPDGGHVTPQSRRSDRGAARSPAAAPGIRGVQHRAAGAAQQRDRPHDADAALLPSRRRQLRAVQRHGPDPARSDRHHPRL